ncbi:MAG: GNAT family N-acetyltransferase, partial [Nocardioides sp.]
MTEAAGPHGVRGVDSSYPVELRAGRFSLREFDDADLAEVHALVSDDRVTTWLSFDAKTPEQTAELLGGILER